MNKDIKENKNQSIKEKIENTIKKIKNTIKEKRKKFTIGGAIVVLIAILTFLFGDDVLNKPKEEYLQIEKERPEIIVNREDVVIPSTARIMAGKNILNNPFILLYTDYIEEYSPEISKLITSFNYKNENDEHQIIELISFTNENDVTEELLLFNFIRDKNNVQTDDTFMLYDFLNINIESPGTTINEALFSSIYFVNEDDKKNNSFKIDPKKPFKLNLNTSLSDNLQNINIKCAFLFNATSYTEDIFTHSDFIKSIEILTNKKDIILYKEGNSIISAISPLKDAAFELKCKSKNGYTYKYILHINITGLREDSNKKFNSLDVYNIGVEEFEKKYEEKKYYNFDDRWKKFKDNYNDLEEGVPYEK